MLTKHENGKLKGFGTFLREEEGMGTVEIIICISAMWSRFMEMRMRKLCLHGMDMERLHLLSRVSDSSC